MWSSPGWWDEGTDPLSTSPEEDWIPVSALQHYAYCPRQCALIHVAQIYEENLFTLRGRSVHERVDAGGSSRRDGMRLERSLPIWSEHHGLTGKADVVEFSGSCIKPVEYKSGKLRNRRGREADRIQLCAQALCLEEMFGTDVEEGALYYAGSKRRVDIPIEESVRRRTLEIVREVRRQFEAARLPAPVNDARCDACSLKEGCLPATAALSGRETGAYLRSLGESADIP